MLYKLTKERTCVPNPQIGMYGQGSSSSSGTGESGGTGSRRSKHESDKSDNSEDEEQEEVLNGNVLMVDQLWLWAIDSRE